MIPENRCYVIAEAGLNHNGSLKAARELIDVAAVAKADAVKFQKRDVDSLAIGTVLDSEDKRFPSLGETYRQIREALEFSKAEYEELKDYSEKRGLDFICTAFDVPSVDFLEDVGLSIYKLASHSITNLPLLEYVAAKKKPVIFSTGMCTIEEIDTAFEILRQNDNELVLMHCVSAYPQPPAESKLRLIGELKGRYHVRIGYSGHELGYVPTLAAVAVGASVVERHFTLDKNMEGFDHKISLEPQELICMIRDIRITEEAIAGSKKGILSTEWITRRKYHVSMVSEKEICRGETISPEMITYKNPGTGVLPRDADQIIGKKAIVDICADTLIERDMVE